MDQASFEDKGPFADELIWIFDQCFEVEFNTILLGGAEEPLYLPADCQSPKHRVFFTRDYFSSALHEVAHWCIAGDYRRQQVDYGYWYAPDGRTADQQQLFEQVEVKPQALEWVFAESSGVRFRVSADNLSQALGPSELFKRAVANQAQQYSSGAMPARAATFAKALCSFYKRRYPLQTDRFRGHALA